MTATTSWRRLAVRAAALVAVGVYAWLGSGTKPFTTGADVTTAVGFAAMCAVMVDTLRRRHRASTNQKVGAVGKADGRLVGWLIAISIFAVWEIAMYFAGFSGNRARFPTLSSLYDSAVRWRAAKAIFLVVWLWLGWGFFGRQSDQSLRLSSEEDR